MNKYWQLYEELLLKTQTGALQWQEIPRQKHRAQIAEPWTVIRQFEAPFFFNDKLTILLCIERRIFVDEDYIFPYVDRTCELLIVMGETLLERVAASNVPWYRLRGFANQVAKTCNRVVIPQQA